MFGYRRIDHGRASTLVVVDLAELNLQLLHFVVVEILLDQVTLSLDSSTHFRGNIGNHPGHKELDHEHNVLHDNDESHLGSQNMPELHSVGVLLLMAGRVAVITIPAISDGAVEPGGVLPVLRFVGFSEL